MCCVIQVLAAVDLNNQGLKTYILILENALLLIS